MNYILSGLIILLLFFVIINYLRKLHWDAVHNNLFNLVDEFGGNVYRRGFLARPVYHGTYQNSEVTINFSQERANSKRRNYINISIDKKLNSSVTIASLDWVKSQGESIDDLEIIGSFEDKKYGIRSNNFSNKKKNDLKTQLKTIAPFNYLFVGKTGLIFEKESKNLGIDTKLNEMKFLIENIHLLSSIF